MSLLAAQINALEAAEPLRVVGHVAGIRGLTLLVDELDLPVGALVGIRPANTGSADARTGPAPSSAGERLLGEIVGVRDGRAVVMLLGGTSGVRAGDPVVGEQSTPTAPVGDRLLGRVIDGLGRPIDGKGPIPDTVERAVHAPPIPALRRRRIREPITTGVRAIDLFCTLGRGQRMGVFAGPGVGKSTLLGAIARRAASDVNVIALIGERGREVKEFIEECLGHEGLARSVVVVATGDESPLLRLRAAHLACAAAEHFRDQGRDVLLMMDSVTRYAHAQRQVGLSAGEPPATRGYTPSVFASLAMLLERAGAAEGAGGSRGGSITGLYAILVEGDDLTEPVTDAARGILDGHVILSRKLAQRAHYPAIDVLDSISRVAGDVCDRHHLIAREQVLRLLAVYREIEELVQIGAYAAGSNPEADVAIEFMPRILDLLRQPRDEAEAFERSRERLIQISTESGEAILKRRREKAR